MRGLNMNGMKMRNDRSECSLILAVPVCSTAGSQNCGPTPSQYCLVFDRNSKFSRTVFSGPITKMNKVMISPSGAMKWSLEDFR
jgi:hypothetical protein